MSSRYLAHYIHTGLVTVEDDFTADAVLQATLSNTFTADAHLVAAGTVSDDFTADAVLLRTESATFTADAALVSTPSATFTADAVIRGPIFYDDFNNRTLTNDHGTPSDRGHYIDHWNASNLNFEIVDGVLRVPAGDQDYFEAAFELGTSTHSGDFYFDFLTSTGAYYVLNAAPYLESAGHYHIGYVEIYDQGGDDWSIFLVGAGDIPVVLTADTWYRLHAYVDAPGHSIKVRIWEVGDPEPTTWDADEALILFVNDNSLPRSSIYVSWWDDSGPNDAEFDNLIIYATGDHRADFLTADAQLLRTISATFTADAFIFTPGEGSFTADAFIVPNFRFGSFTADARLKKVVAGTFTANARLVSTDVNTFTADAYIYAAVERTFTANAFIYRPVDPERRLVKNTSLTILQRREKPLPTYLPPKIPDASEPPDDGLGGPPCLPPCPGAGAGYGTGYGVNGGAVVKVITRCTSGSCPETFFNDGDTWIGQGPVTFGTHCDCATSHSRSAHVNRMWITYTTIPTTTFRMRAKMIWDVGSPPNVTVNVYANASAPSVDIDDCSGSGDYWDNGTLIGRLSFSADANSTIAGRPVWFQTESSQLVIDPGAINTNTFRFALEDEGQFYRAEFKASTVSIITDGATTTTNPPAAGGLYIAPNGNNSNPGTIDSPKQTILAASALLSPGQTLWMRGGNYFNEGGFNWQASGTAAAPVTLRAYPGEIPVIDGQGTDSHGIIISGDSHVVIDGIKITNTGMGPSGDGGILLLNASHITIRNCKFVNNGAQFQSDHSIYINSGCSFLTIEDSVFHNTPGGHIHAFHPPGPTDVIIRRNQIGNPAGDAAYWGVVIGNDCAGAARWQINDNVFRNCDFNIDNQDNYPNVTASGNDPDDTIF